MKVVRDIMHNEVTGISKNATFGAALKLMRASRVNSITVIDNGKLYGILTEDLAGTKEVQAKLVSVQLKHIFAEENEKIEKAANKMLDSGLSRLPVVASKYDLRCIGTITSTDIARYLKRKLL